ncbi:formimidoylglutamase [Oceanospirillum sp.]|uniref:formimidoylglutamase n=1 Tax=Oceanospirillum sp. TaxID=2021254 RepID=UPI003A93D468
MTYNPVDMTVWAGRVDSEEAGASTRWHQEISPLPADGFEPDGIAILGFACDEGVRRNKGRQGAKEGPAAIRRALSNAAWHLPVNAWDAGDVSCDDASMEVAQNQLAAKITFLLDNGLKPVVLGGGHEIAWGSYQGLAQHIYAEEKSARIGIVNLDAHLDLRNPDIQPSSGTPFRQIAQWCNANNKAFNYYCIGVNETANTQALFEFARERGVKWRLDRDCKATDLEAIQQDIKNYLTELDYLYLTICLDAFSVAVAPGVSAPSIMGLDAVTGCEIIRLILKEAATANVPVVLTDIAECNPLLDEDHRTAKLAARLVAEVSQELTRATD